MAGSILEIITIFAIAIIINLVFYQFAKGGFLDLECPEPSSVYGTISENFTVGNTTYTQTIDWHDILNMVTGRCSGLPLWVVLIVETPLLLGLIYVGRMLVGLT